MIWILVSLIAFFAAVAAGAFLCAETSRNATLSGPDSLDDPDDWGRQ